MPRKKIRVTVEDPVKVTGLDKFKVTGLDKVKVTGLDRVMVNPKPSSFDVSDIQSLKVQVSSTTSTPKAKVKRRTTVPVTSSLDDLLAAAKKSCKIQMCQIGSKEYVWIAFVFVFNGFPF